MPISLELDYLHSAGTNFALARSKVDSHFQTPATSRVHLILSPEMDELPVSVHSMEPAPVEGMIAAIAEQRLVVS